jgi:hypothetical protein
MRFLWKMWGDKRVVRSNWQSPTSSRVISVGPPFSEVAAKCPKAAAPEEVPPLWGCSHGSTKRWNIASYPSWTRDLDWFSGMRVSWDYSGTIKPYLFNHSIINAIQYDCRNLVWLSISVSSWFPLYLLTMMWKSQCHWHLPFGDGLYHPERLSSH